MCFRERERKIQSVKAWRSLKPTIEGQICTFTELVYVQVILPNIIRTSPVYMLPDGRLVARITKKGDNSVSFEPVSELSRELQEVKWFIG